MLSEETARGRKFAFVLRLRPDTAPLCGLPRDPSSWLASGYAALIPDDLAVLMRRDAASIALDIYSRAEGLPACRLKFELCVPALLVESGFLVGDLSGGAFAIARSNGFCEDPSSLRYPPNMRCGRSQVLRLQSKEPLPRWRRRVDAETMGAG